MRPSGKGPRVQSFMLYKDPWALLASSFTYTLRGVALWHTPQAAAASYLRYSHTYMHTYIHIHLSFLVLSPYSTYVNSLPRACTGAGACGLPTMHFRCCTRGPRVALQ